MVSKAQEAREAAAEETRNNREAARNTAEPQPSTSTEDVVVKGRTLTPPVEETQMGSAKAVREKMRQALDEGRAKQRDAAPVTVDASTAKIVPNIGQPRAQSSEEIRQEQEDQADGVSQAAPYPGNPHDAQVKAILASERQRDSGEFNTEDMTGHSLDGDGKTDTVVVRLLYDWWDGQGVRHPLNSLCEVPLNEARNLLDQRKAERTDPLRPMR